MATITTITLPVKRSVIVKDPPGRLDNCEARIRANHSSVWETAEAIKEIFDNGLYKDAGFKNFKDYCTLRLTVSWRWAFMLKNAVKIRGTIETAVARLQQDSKAQDTPGNLSPGELSSPGEAAVATAPTIEVDSGNQCPVRRDIVSVHAAAVIAAMPADQQQQAVEAIAIASKNGTQEITQEAAKAIAEDAAKAAARKAKPKKSEAVIAAEEAIANGQKMKDLLKQVKAATKTLMGLPQIPGLELINSRKSSIHHHLEQAANLISSYTPTAVCPKCNGKHCPDCGNYGWISKSAEKALNHKTR